MEELDLTSELKAELNAQRQQRRPFPARAVFRHVFVPAMLALAIAPWIRHHESGRLFVDSVGNTAAASTMLFVSILVIWLAEQLFPARAEWNARPLSDG